MKVFTYSQGDTFIYDDNGELVLSFIKMSTNRFQLSVYDDKSIEKINAYTKQCGQLHFTSLKND